MRFAPSLLALTLSAAACSNGSASPAPPSNADASPDAPPGPVTWTALPQLTPETLLAVWAGGDVVIAVGTHGAAVRSIDGGRTFQLAPIAPSMTPGYQLSSIFGSSEDDLYAAGSATFTTGVLYHSTDRGATWTAVDTGGSAELTSVWASGANDVYVGSSDGSILRSTDRGATWTSVFHDPTVSIHGLSGTGPGDVLAAASFETSAAGDAGLGDAGDAGPSDADLDVEAAAPPPLGLVLHGTDSATLWSVATTVTSGPLWSISACPGGDTGYVVGGGATVIAMLDHASGWEPLSGSRFADYPLPSVACATGATTPFIAGERHGFLTTVSFDDPLSGAGAAEGEALPGSSAVVYGVWATTRSSVWAVGGAGGLWHRTTT